MNPIDLGDMGSRTPAAANENPMEMELRGYEVAKKTVVGWQQVSRWRPTMQGWREASIAAAWLQDRHQKDTYRVRPIVSMKAPEAVPQPRPMVLEADTQPECEAPQVESVTAESESE